jgi:hypothetical protein
MDFSLPAWLGATAGTAIGAVIYAALIGVIDRGLRSLETPQTRLERDEQERRLSVARRTILAADIVLCAAAGYWIGALWDAPAKAPL